jgi:hypothetical protein
MNYPTIEEVVRANREEICGWWKFLRRPETPAEERIMTLIYKKFNAFGGYSLEIRERLAKVQW